MDIKDNSFHSFFIKKKNSSSTTIFFYCFVQIFRSSKRLVSFLDFSFLYLCGGNNFTHLCHLFTNYFNYKILLFHCANKYKKYFYKVRVTRKELFRGKILRISRCISYLFYFYVLLKVKKQENLIYHNHLCCVKMFIMRRYGFKGTCFYTNS